MSSSDNREIAQKMIKKAKEKLDTAMIDFRNERFDDSVSRSYYAVYHSISAVLFLKGFEYSSHNQTIGGFNKEFIKAEILPSHFTKKINKLFNDRQTGDYGFDSEIEKEIALENIQIAEEIMNSCRDFLESN